MLNLVVPTVFFVIVITFLSFFTKRMEKRVLFPLAFVFISIVLFFISFIIGEWEGMGLGAISVLLFLASIIALIAIVMLYKISPNSSKNHHQY